MKRYLSILVVLALMVSLLPLYPPEVGAATFNNGANNSKQTNFIFPDIVPKVNYKYVNFTGTLNQVSPNEISYSVKNVSSGKETARMNRGVTVADDGVHITVANVELFDGNNVITFYGKQGSTEITNIYEITYISTPLLYNLQFTGGGKKLPLDASDRTIVTNSFTTSGEYFTIEGNAPNVDQVIVRNGDYSVSATVNQDIEAYFIVGRVKLTKGLNTLTFYLKNANQTVEVKRDVVYFDGTGTYYDVKMSYSEATPYVSDFQDLSANPLIKKVDSTKTNSELRSASKFEGYVIIPKGTSNNPLPNRIVRISHEKSDGTILGSPANVIFTNLKTTNEYYVFKFTYDGNELSDSAFPMGTEVFPRFESFNPNINDYDDQSPKTLSYKFLDLNTPVMTYLKYYVDLNNVRDLIDNSIINERPFTIRVGVTHSPTLAPSIEVTNDFGSKGVADITAEPTVGSDNEFDIVVNSLPFDGTQTLRIYINKSLYPDIYQEVRINAAAGPVLSFEGLSDEMIFKYDPNLSNGADGYTAREADENGNLKKVTLIEDVLKDFAGKIENVIVTAGDYANGAATFKINNYPVDLVVSGSSANQFKADLSQIDRRKLSSYFHDGQNTLLFRYEKGNITYEKKFILNLYSISFPEIPAANTNGVFPYAGTERKPDARFNGSDGIYTTKETEMDITGTFDFIDLGKKRSDVVDAVRDLPTGEKYLFVVEGSDGFKAKWNLKEDELLDIADNRALSNDGDDVKDLSVYYDLDHQYFIFDIKNRNVPTDGSKLVYTFTVYNNGENGGSKASYRLEVSAPGMNYRILRPIVTGDALQQTINQNYLEVVIESRNADSVVINKIPAEKVSFDNDMDGDTNDATDSHDAWRAIITDLKPNKANEIQFTITKGTDVVSDSFEVFYAPATIPGAQYLSPMNKGVKIFDKKLSLKFPSQTYLVRSDYNVPQNLRGQVFEEHQILYSIANSEDGVVDRFDYLPNKQRPANFDDTVASLASQFRNTFDSHFVKISPVYWIDGGLADDPNTSEYDSYPFGNLPIMPNPREMDPKRYNYNDVPSNRQLVPTKRGTLEIAYDENAVLSANHSISVMRYNPEGFWENVGGKVNTSRNTIEVPFDKFGYYVVAKLNDSFSDVIRHPYARNNMETAYAKGVILPRNFTSFGPDYPTTRGEFAAMVVRALQIPLVENVPSSFDDVLTDLSPTSLYDYRHIETAARLGIVKGTEPRIFNPSGKITREEAAIILARALEFKLVTSNVAAKKSLTKLFKDYNLISNYAMPAVLAVAKAKLIEGSPVDPNNPKSGSVFEPKATMLRGDAAILMTRVMTHLKLIPPVYEGK
ncbi:S-layer homology domain-containing protein [Ammoniphilus resinae]|uniref:SLH domain-containing protein n=1 Tax=Ammoniphilus resinae TaxID=861532 RepID=A0ABS4GMJ2_9BACL|nr:S-layer homology domain-containing protein [Ammoniphilus resinae]MBP1931493.1 hypothetical protein [Ammoniphilus resinae]